MSVAKYAYPNSRQVKTGRYSSTVMRTQPSPDGDLAIAIYRMNLQACGLNLAPTPEYNLENLVHRENPACLS